MIFIYFYHNDVFKKSTVFFPLTHLYSFMHYDKVWWTQDEQVTTASLYQ